MASRERSLFQEWLVTQVPKMCWYSDIVECRVFAFGPATGQQSNFSLTHCHSPEINLPQEEPSRRIRRSLVVQRGSSTTRHRLFDACSQGEIDRTLRPLVRISGQDFENTHGLLLR